MTHYATTRATGRAYHWLRDDMTAGCGDEPAWTEGEERTVTGNISLCNFGYHSSPTPFDGLEYAPGSVLCLVEISEPVGSDETKSVSATRKLIRAVNVERQLREFACDVAEEALNLEVQRGYTVDERSRVAIEIARRFARAQASPEEWAAAWDAARAAAWDAAWDAARDAQKAKFNATMQALFEDADLPR